MTDHCWALLRFNFAAAIIATDPTLALSTADLPHRPFKIVVPLRPGHTLDYVPRVVGEKLTTKWGDPVVVENRPGAASNIGAEAVFKSPPDGYTLLVTPPGPLAVSQHVYTKLNFDPAQFTPVTVTVRFPFMLIANTTVPDKSLQDLVARAKASPGKITFATPGVSSTPHL